MQSMRWCVKFDEYVWINNLMSTIDPKIKNNSGNCIWWTIFLWKRFPVKSVNDPYVWFQVTCVMCWFIFFLKHFVVYFGKKFTNGSKCRGPIVDGVWTDLAFPGWLKSPLPVGLPLDKLQYLLSCWCHWVEQIAGEVTRRLIFLCFMYSTTRGNLKYSRYHIHKLPYKIQW